MITKLQTIKEIPHSAKVFFALALLIIALTPMQALINNTQQPLITGIIWLICGILLISSFHSQRLSQQPVQCQRMIIFITIAAVMQSIDQIFSITLLSPYSFALNLYGFALLLRIEKRKISLSIHWLIILYLLSIPEWGFSNLLQYTLHPTDNQLSWLLGTAILFTTGMTIIHPSRPISLLFIGLFLSSCLLSRWLNSSAIAVVSLLSLFIILIIGKVNYRQTKKPHPFTDTTTWLIPKVLEKDGWWIAPEEAKKKQRQLTQLSLVFLAYALLINLY